MPGTLARSRRGGAGRGTDPGFGSRWLQGPAPAAALQPGHRLHRCGGLVCPGGGELQGQVGCTRAGEARLCEEKWEAKERPRLQRGCILPRARRPAAARPAGLGHRVAGPQRSAARGRAARLGVLWLARGSREPVRESCAGVAHSRLSLHVDCQQDDSHLACQSGCRSARHLAGALCQGIGASPLFPLRLRQPHGRLAASCVPPTHPRNAPARGCHGPLTLGCNCNERACVLVGVCVFPIAYA